MKTLLLLLAFSSQSFAEVCSSGAHGKIVKLSEAYDLMAAKLPGANDWQKTLQKYLDQHGLPIEFAVPENGAKGVRDYLETDSMAGNAVLAFVKRMRPPTGSNLMLDDVYEVESADAKKAKRKWKIPSNQAALIGVDGEELHYQAMPGPLCLENYAGEFKVTYAIRPDGRFRVLPLESDENLDSYECAAAKATFKKSELARCRNFFDLKTKKTRVLVFELPTT